VKPGIALDQAGSPFQRYAANGLRTDLPPEVVSTLFSGPATSAPGTGRCLAQW
jgi:hypothetical protein